MRLTASVLFSSIVVSALCTSQSAAQVRKGTWRDPDRLTIEGAKYFTGDDIRKKLLEDFDIAETRHPLAPPDEYVRKLSEVCKAGYLHAGFADVKLEGHINEKDGNLLLKIAEGSQYRCGDIVVQGAVNIDPRTLINWLATQQPPNGSIHTGDTATNNVAAGQWVDPHGTLVELDAPAWRIGEQAQLSDVDRQVLAQKLTRAFAEAGYPWARFELVTKANEQTGLARLTVKIFDEGPFARIDKIEILGNKRDSEKDICDYLAVKPGLVVNESLRTSLMYKLWASGRYLMHYVEILPPGGNNPYVTMRLRLREYESVTPLREPLSKVEEVLLKYREWLLASKQRQDDWVVTMRGAMNARAVFSPKYGLLLHLERREQVDDKDDPYVGLPTLPEAALVIGPREVRYANENLKRNFCISLPSSRSTLSLTMRLRTFNDVQQPDHKFSLWLGAGLKVSGNDTNQPPIEFRLGIDPAYILNSAHEDGANCLIEDNVLKVRSEVGYLDVDANTGRLLRWQYRRDESASHHFELSIRPNGFEESLATADRRLSGRISSNENEYDPQCGWSSFARVVLDDSMVPLIGWLCGLDKSQKDRVAKGAQSLRSLVSRGLLHPLDKRLANNDDDVPKRDDTTHKFEIPKIVNGADEDWLTMIRAPLAKTMFQIGDEGLPQDSWTSTLCRNVGYVCIGKTRYVGDDLNFLWKAKDFGPLGHLSAAEALKYVNPGGSAAFARRGLEVASAKSFAMDVAPLIAEDSETFHLFAHLAEVLRELSDEEAKNLGELFLDEKGFILADVARWLREYRDRPVEEVLPLIMPAIWDMGIRTVVENRLRELAGENVAVKPEKPADAKRE